LAQDVSNELHQNLIIIHCKTTNHRSMFRGNSFSHKPLHCNDHNRH